MNRADLDAAIEEARGKLDRLLDELEGEKKKLGVAEAEDDELTQEERETEMRRRIAKAKLRRSMSDQMDKSLIRYAEKFVERKEAANG